MSDLIDEVSPPAEAETVTGQTLRFRRMTLDDWAALKVRIVRERKHKLYVAVNQEIPEEDWQRRLAAKAAVDTEVESVATIHWLMDYCRLDPAGIKAVLLYALLDHDATAPAEREKLLRRLNTVQQIQTASEIVMRPVVPPANPSTPGASADGSTGPTGDSASATPNPTGATSSDESPTSGPATPPAV